MQSARSLPALSRAALVRIALILVAAASAVVSADDTVGRALTTQQIVKRAGNAVVRIETADRSGKRQGSGFVVDGSIVTALHVIDGAPHVRIVFHDGTTIEDVAVQAFDVAADLAVLATDAATAASGIELGDPSGIVPGTRILVLGSPLGFEQTITEGIASAWREPGESRGMPGRRSEGSHPLLLLCRVLQISAALSPGSSGGPVLNEQGQVVGVATSGVLHGGSGLNFAVPVDRLRPLLDENQGLDLETFRKHVDAVRLELARPYFDSAELSFERGEQRAGTHYLDLALLAFPRYAEALLLAGRIAQRQGQHDLAEARFQEAVDSAPENAEAWYALGDALHSRALAGNDASLRYGARQAYVRALALDAWHARAAYGLALIEANQGDLARAEELLTTATTAEPRFTDALAALGDIYLAQERVNEAKDLFERALWEDENHARSHFGLAKLYTILEVSPFGTVSAHGRAATHWEEFLRLSEGDPALAAEREFALVFVQEYFPHLLR